MTQQEEITYLKQAMQLSGFSVNDMAVDHIIQLNKLIKSKKGKTNILDVTRLQAEINYKYKDDKE